MLSTPSQAIVDIPVAESTCDTPGCTYSGAAFYFRGDNAYCGRCMDRLDDMPYLTSSFAWGVLKEMDAR